MGMKIEQSSLDRTLERLSKTEDAVNLAIEDVLAEVGEYVSNGIRSNELSSWIDHTGNLRSSVGYAVIRRGQVVRMSDFGTVLNGSEGPEKGRQSVAEAASRYAQYDYVLVIVAGEEYAVYVEAIEGKAVLSEGYIHIERNLPKLLKERVKQALNGL